jgi:hypothetical protein
MVEMVPRKRNDLAGGLGDGRPGDRSGGG